MHGLSRGNLACDGVPPHSVQEGIVRECVREGEGGCVCKRGRGGRGGDGQGASNIL